MNAESTQNFDALEALGRKLTQTFIAHGAELVAPAIVQPAGLFLDVVGEQLRGRTYVFTDPDGLELCLRPDLTVPTCRIYLERDPNALSVSRFCYSGPVFRYQPQQAPVANAREARQAGFEIFGAKDQVAADVEVLRVTIAALKAAGLEQMQLRMGDLGLLTGLLDALHMPERWRQRLKHRFWRSDIFRAELERLVEGPVTLPCIDKGLLDALDPSKPEEALAEVAAYLERQGIEVIGTRQLEEISAGLVEAAADEREQPLPREHAQLIEAYVAISDAPARAADRLDALVAAAKCDISPAIAAFRERLEVLASLEIDLETARFSGDFGRRFEYYTGFVFDIVAEPLGERSPIAGGGRYDRLLAAVGAPRDVAAVGAAIHTERLRTLIEEYA
jgi:ATP phosphoribosyltransferase regulatory subunit